MSSKQGYSITTRRLRLRCKHPEWLKRTQDLFNEIQLFYYELYLEHPEIWELNSQKTLHELEVMSLPGKEKRVPVTPFPWENIPPYFRRAAANAGIAAAKSFVAREQDKPGHRAKNFHSSVVYYQRMYKDFTSSSISLKVWDGNEWHWLHCRLFGEEFPEDAQIMSPSVVFDNEFIMLHVPIKEMTSDTSTVKVRIQDGSKICGVQFTNGNAFAVACIMNECNEELAVRFFKGGNAYVHHCNHILEKIEKSQKSLGASYEGKANQKYWLHLKNLAEHHAHQVSRSIVDFCKEYDVKIIALPKYDNDFSRNVMIGAGDWSPIHLSIRIHEYLNYKAWKEGIIVIDVNAKGISSLCANCGKEIVHTNKKIKEAVCVEGHRVNRYLNAARNLTKKCRQQLEKKRNTALII